MADKKAHHTEPAVSAHSFYALRGRGVAQYASLEQALCLLFSVLTGMSFDISGLVFFKITSARSRNALIEELLRRRGYYQSNKDFWKDYLSKIGSLDQRRNEIVHWVTIENIDTAESPARVTILLVPAKHGIMLISNMAQIDAQDLKRFAEQCHVYERACNAYTIALMHKAAPSPDIFGQPLPYPLPDTHPLSRTNTEQQNQRPPSQG